MPVNSKPLKDSILTIQLSLMVVFVIAAMGKCHGQTHFDGSEMRVWKAPNQSGQPPQPEKNREVWTPPVRPNQPFKLEDDSQQNPGNEIREQIGLATFEQPVEQPLEQPFKQPLGESRRTDGAKFDQKNKNPSNPISFLQGSAIAPAPADLKEDERDKPKPSAYEFQFPKFVTEQSESLTAPSGIGNSIKLAVMIGALSLAPAIILMTTCYIRVVVVLSLLKQAFGGQQLPPAQVVTALSLFLTFLIMTPVWNELKVNAIDPYSEKKIDWNEAWERGVAPIRAFMIRQIELAGNEESVEVFYKHSHVATSTPPSDLSTVPLNVLIPAFMISELKVAFLLGFQIYLPFLVLDLIVSSVTVSMGMVMLPPQMISFPMKLILFVMVDGWNLVIGLLLQSFGGGP